MADWKPQISYNYNPSYHAYAYGLMYQPGPEQHRGTLSSWSEAGDLSNYSPGVTPVVNYASTVRTKEESPPCSPENHHHVNGQLHYQGSGVVYLADTQARRLIFNGQYRGAYDTAGHEARQVGCDSTSDSEAHTSPDSWSSGSSREESLPREDPITWAKNALDEETSSRSPDASEHVSSSLIEEAKSFVIKANDCTDNSALQPAPTTAPNNQSISAESKPKGKVRAAFSESQMNTLRQRFSVQRYLTPAEMKNVAELTGLTYKQVKTWFQNRRMKLRRHQKDNAWAPERCAANKESPVRGPIYHNVNQHIPPYQGESQPQLKEHYNQHMMEAAMKNTSPQNLAFYLAAMRSAAGSAGYPSWHTSSQQLGLQSRPQAAGWSMPPGVPTHEYNHNAFSSVSVNNTGRNFSYEDKDGEVGIQSTMSPAMVHDISQ